MFSRREGVSIVALEPPMPYGRWLVGYITLGGLAITFFVLMGWSISTGSWIQAVIAGVACLIALVLAFGWWLPKSL